MALPFVFMEKNFNAIRNLTQKYMKGIYKEGDLIFTKIFIPAKIYSKSMYCN